MCCGPPKGTSEWREADMRGSAVVDFNTVLT